MYFTILNKNISEAYPNIPKVFNMVTYFDKQSGLDYSAIEISSIEDLLTLGALAKSTNEFYTGMIISGTEIKLNDGTL